MRTQIGFVAEYHRRRGCNSYCNGTTHSHVFLLAKPIPTNIPLAQALQGISSVDIIIKSARYINEYTKSHSEIAAHWRGDAHISEDIFHIPALVSFEIVSLEEDVSCA